MASSKAVDGPLVVAVEETADRLSVGSPLMYGLVSWGRGSRAAHRLASGRSR